MDSPFCDYRPDHYSDDHWRLPLIKDGLTCALRGIRPRRQARAENRRNRAFVRSIRARCPAAHVRAPLISWNFRSTTPGMISARWLDVALGLVSGQVTCRRDAWAPIASRWRGAGPRDGARGV